MLIGKKEVKTGTLLWVVLIVFFLFHLYNISAPPNGYHHWRESDTAAISLNYYQDNLPFSTPKSNEVLSSNPTVKVEFPIYYIAVSSGYKIFGFHHLVPHLISLFSGLCFLFFLFKFTRLLTDETTALFSTIAGAFSPLLFYYSYKIMPDMMMMAFWMSGIYFYLRYIKVNRLLYWLVSLVLMSLAVSIKPFCMAVYLPLLLYQFQNTDKKIQKIALISIHGIIALLPMIVWMYSINWLGERSLLMLEFVDYLFSDIFFKKMVLQWPFELWIGWVMVIPFIFGVYHSIKTKKFWFNGVWFAGLYFLLVLVARYSRIHDYYSLILIPPIAIFIGIGLKKMLDGPKWIRVFLAVLVIATPINAFLRIKHRFGDTSEYNLLQTEAGKYISENSLVVVEDHSRGAIPLYQLGRKGFYIENSLEIEKIREYRNLGAEYLLLRNRFQTEELFLLVDSTYSQIGNFNCYKLK